MELNHVVAKYDSDLDEDDQGSLGKTRKADIPTEDGINCIAGDQESVVSGNYKV